MACKLEIIGFNIQSCVAAQNAGADRIELCDNFSEGGTTPSYAFIKAARKKLSIELYVMIRPRGGDFFYDEDEFDLMKQNITLCKETGCDGVVLGILTSAGNVDKERCQLLIDYAYPLGVTFHRAFDRAYEPFCALEDVIEIGCERILTSGQKPKATGGAELLKQLVEKAEDRIIIMPGSGVNATNLAMLAETTGAREFHSSASLFLKSKMEYNNERMNEELQHITVDQNEIAAMVKILAGL
jgi:copper homeostasis protein